MHTNSFKGFCTCGNYASGAFLIMNTTFEYQKWGVATIIFIGKLCFLPVYKSLGNITDGTIAAQGFKLVYSDVSFYTLFKF